MKNLLEDAKAGKLLEGKDLVKLGFQRDNNNFIFDSYTKNKVEISFYGGYLSAIYIDDESIEELVEIPPCRGCDDELDFRITEEALIYTYKKAGIVSPEEAG